MHRPRPWAKSEPGDSSAYGINRTSNCHVFLWNKWLKKTTYLQIITTTSSFSFISQSGPSSVATQEKKIASRAAKWARTFQPSWWWHNLFSDWCLGFSKSLVFNFNGEPCHSLTRVAVGCVWESLQSQTLRNLGKILNVRTIREDTSDEPKGKCYPLSSRWTPVPVVFYQTYFQEVTNKSVLSIEQLHDVFLRNNTSTHHANGLPLQSPQENFVSCNLLHHRTLIIPRTDQ